MYDLKSDSQLKEYIKKCYREILDREADESGLNHFLSRMKKGTLKPENFPVILKNTKKKLAKGNLSTSEWMKRTWNYRIEKGEDELIKRFTHPKVTPQKYWEGGEQISKNILGVGSLRYDLIFNGKDPKDLKALEIGCGMGRLLVPMSKIFGEIVGIDVSPEILRICRKHTKDIPNCKLYENNGWDISMFDDNYFDFCYSFVVFQHIPEKKVIINYIKEISRILKTGKIFRFQIRGTPSLTPDSVDSTMNGVSFTQNEIHIIAKENKFEILEEKGISEQYYLLTFKSIK